MRIVPGVRAAVLATALLVLIAVGLSAPPPVRGDASGLFGWMFSNLNLVSVEQEAEIGRNLAKEVESQQHLLRDIEVEDYVSDLGQKLVAQTKPQFRYHFRIVDDPSVNAFGIGGGYIYVNSGLLALSDSEGEVVAVLAHEIGHQVKRHVAKQMSRQTVFESLARAAVGPNAGQWIDLAAGLGVTTGQLYFGREAEREADSVMIDLMPRAGYDPREALAMFQKLRSIQGSDPGAVATIFSSHPPTRERSDAVAAALSRRRLPGGLIRTSARFPEIRRRVASEQQEPRR